MQLPMLVEGLSAGKETKTPLGQPAFGNVASTQVVDVTLADFESIVSGTPVPPAPSLSADLPTLPADKNTISLVFPRAETLQTDQRATPATDREQPKTVPLELAEEKRGFSRDLAPSAGLAKAAARLSASSPGPVILPNDIALPPEFAPTPSANAKRPTETVAVSTDDAARLKPEQPAVALNGLEFPVSRRGGETPPPSIQRPLTPADDGQTRAASILPASPKVSAAIRSAQLRPEDQSALPSKEPTPLKPPKPVDVPRQDPTRPIVSREPPVPPFEAPPKAVGAEPPMRPQAMPAPEAVVKSLDEAKPQAEPAVAPLKDTKNPDPEIARAKPEPMRLVAPLDRLPSDQLPKPSDPVANAPEFLRTEKPAPVSGRPPEPLPQTGPPKTMRVDSREEAVGPSKDSRVAARPDRPEGPGALGGSVEVVQRIAPEKWKDRGHLRLGERTEGTARHSSETAQVTQTPSNASPPNPKSASAVGGADVPQKTPALGEVTEPRTFAPMAVAEASEIERPNSFDTIRPAQTTASPRADVARSVAQQMSAAITQSGDGTIDVRLSPEDLGRVRLALTPTELGVSVSIVAERPETMDLVRRNIEMLAQDLKQNGFQNLSFAFGQGSDSSAKKQVPFFDSREPRPTAEETNRQPNPVKPATVSGRLDVRL